MYGCLQIVMTTELINPLLPPAPAIIASKLNQFKPLAKSDFYEKHKSPEDISACDAIRGPKPPDRHR